jgi:hypothetical protein
MSRTSPSPKIQELAQRLLAYEAARVNPCEANIPAVLRVSEKLRRSLSTLVGSSGFRSLLARALTLAKVQVPALSAVQVQPDGSLERWIDFGNEDQPAEACVILIAQLLGLLVAFIGEGVTLSLGSDCGESHRPSLLRGENAWPESATRRPETASDMERYRGAIHGLLAGGIACIRESHRDQFGEWRTS